MCTCPAGAMMCGGVCVANDVQNCGACGNECASGSTCNGTECVCAVNNASGMTPVVCAAPANACFSDACAHDADCCLGVCDGNVCCARPGSPCSSAEDCGDSSGKDVCASSPSQDHLQCGSNNQCCVGHYGSCGANSDCCSSYSCVAGYCLL